MQTDNSVLVVMPTLTLLGNNLEKYIRLMRRSELNFSIGVVDDSTKIRMHENIKLLKNMEDAFSKTAPLALYHFGHEEQRRFFSLLGENGVNEQAIRSLMVVPSYGNAQNKEVLLATLLNARILMCFGDDTSPYDRYLFKKYYLLLKTTEKPLIICGKLRGVSGTDYALFESKIGIEKEFIRKIFETFEEYEQPAFKEKRLFILRDVIGQNFAINSVYQDIVCPPLKKTHSMDEFFPVYDVRRKGGSVLSGKTVNHKRTAERRGLSSNPEYVIDYIMSFVRRHLFYILLSEIERDFGNFYLEPTENVRSYLEKKSGKFEDLVTAIREDLAKLNIGHCNENLDLVIKRLCHRETLKELEELIIGGYWDFLRLRKEWPKIIEIAKRTNPASIFKN